MPPIRIIFMGTAQIACASLDALAHSPAFEVSAIVTQPDRPKGRDLKPRPPPVKQLAVKLNLPVFQPERARDEGFARQLRERAPDLIVVVAYGQILPRSILGLPRFGCLNLHTSLLPKYRGAAPIQWAILNDESETGVTVMKMDAGLDTGDIVTARKTPIEPADTAQTLHDRLAKIGAELLAQTIPDYVSGKIAPRRQPEEGASHAPKISKEDARIDWSRPARQIRNAIRAFTPWPGAFTWSGAGDRKTRLKIWEAAPAEAASGAPGEILSAGKPGVLVACGTGALRITRLQREGGRVLNAGEFLAGAPVRAGDRLG